MSIYTHKHHIIPEHMGGTNNPENLVEVTVEKHAELHKQLWEDLGHWQDYVAWQALSGTIGKEDIIRLIQRNTHLGEKRTDESKRKMSIAQTGKKQKVETVEKRRQKLIGQKRKFINKDQWIEKQSIAKKGKPSSFVGMKHTEESKEKNRLSHIGTTYNRGRKFEKVECDRCGMTISINRISVHQNGLKCS